MWKDNKIAISEVNKILNQLPSQIIEKIPRPLLKEIEENASENVDYITINTKLEDLNLQNETKEILAVLSYNYFCDENEKKEFIEELKENEKKYHEELAKKYDVNNIFKKDEKVKKEKIAEEKDTVEMIEVKESFWIKIWNKIKVLFKQL